MRAANEVARFLLELCALAAFAYGAAQSVDGPARYALAVVAALAAAGFWGVLMAPTAKRRLADPVRLVVEIVFFAGAGVTLVAVGALWLGVALAVLAIANAVSLRFHDPVLGALG
jgi:hypothetical protein